MESNIANRNQNLPAFAALNESEAFIGLTKKEYVAASIAQGLLGSDYLQKHIVSDVNNVNHILPESFAEEVVLLTDELLKQLSQT